MCVCVCVCICVFVHVGMHVNIHMWEVVDAGTYVHMYICTCGRVDHSVTAECLNTVCV